MSKASERLSDLVQHRRDVDGEVTTHRFANGLTVKTEAFLKRDPLRILPLGGPQCSLMNHLLHFPDAVRGKRWSIRDDFAARFGEMFLVPSDDVEELALARVLENFVP